MLSCLLESVGAVNQLEILQNYKNKVYVNLVNLQFYDVLGITRHHSTFFLLKWAFNITLRQTWVVLVAQNVLRKRQRRRDFTIRFLWMGTHIFTFEPFFISEQQNRQVFKKSTINLHQKDLNLLLSQLTCQVEIFSQKYPLRSSPCPYYKCIVMPVCHTQPTFHKQNLWIQHN